MPDREILRGKDLQEGDIVHQIWDGGQWYFEMREIQNGQVRYAGVKRLKDISKADTEAMSISLVYWDSWLDDSDHKGWKFYLIKRVNKEPKWRI